MTAPGNCVDVSAALGSSSSSSTTAPGNPRSLLKWQIQVKIMTTRITVLKRFGRKFSSKSLKCAIAPGLASASPRHFSTVQDRLEETHSSEHSSTRDLNAGVLFSPNSPVQDEPKKKITVFPASRRKNGEGLSLKMGDIFKDRRTLSPILMLLSVDRNRKKQTISDDDRLEEVIVGLFIVTVIVLDSRKEGTTATYNPVQRITTARLGLLVLLVLLYFSDGAYAQGGRQCDSADGTSVCPAGREELPYDFKAKAVAYTVVAGIFMIAIAGWANRRPLLAPPAIHLPFAAPFPDPRADLLPVPGPVEQLPAELFNVMAALAENREAARTSDPDFHILPALDGITGPVQRGLQ